MLIIPPPQPAIYLMADPAPMLPPSGDASYLDEYTGAYYVQRGYTVPFGGDFSDYADTTALLAGVPEISSRNGRCPKSHLITKVNDDPIFPNRMIECLCPYNDLWTGAVGSAGELMNITKTIGQVADNVWWQFERRYGGTAHPTRPSSGSYTHEGDYPASSANAIKVNFGLWTGPDYSGGRLEIVYNGINTLLVGAGYGQQAGSPQGTEAFLTQSGVTSFFTEGTGQTDESALFTGANIYQYSFNYYRVDDNTAIYRLWRQQLNLGTEYEPQDRVFSGLVFNRSSGAVMPLLNGVEFYANKNNTNKSDVLSSQDWDSPPDFRDSATEGSPVSAGLKPYDGIRWYMPHPRIVYGADDRPFTDHKGTNLDDDGRSDANWPPGA